MLDCSRVGNEAICLTAGMNFQAPVLSFFSGAMEHRPSGHGVQNRCCLSMFSKTEGSKIVLEKIGSKYSTKVYVNLLSYQPDIGGKKRGTDRIISQEKQTFNSQSAGSATIYFNNLI